MCKYVNKYYDYYFLFMVMHFLKDIVVWWIYLFLLHVLLSLSNCYTKGNVVPTVVGGSVSNKQKNNNNNKAMGHLGPCFQNFKGPHLFSQTRINSLKSIGHHKFINIVFLIKISFQNKVRFSLNLHNSQNWCSFVGFVYRCVLCSHYFHGHCGPVDHF